MIATLIGYAVGALFFGLIIWIVSKLNLGLRVDTYWWAVALVIWISVISNIILF